MIRTLFITSLTLCVVALSGCSRTVRPLNTEFPTPLIEALPLSLGIYYDDDLRNFTYNETVSDGSTWQIELGQNNTRLFDRLFGAMFSQLVVVDDIDNPPPHVEGVIQPVLEEYAFLTPREMGSRFYAVSIRYRIFLFDTNGNELAAWPVNAYGQSREGGRKTAKGVKASPIQEATNLAMRDAAAGIVVMLPQQDEIKSLINGDVADTENEKQEGADDEFNDQEPDDEIDETA